MYQRYPKFLIILMLLLLSVAACSQPQMSSPAPDFYGGAAEAEMPMSPSSSVGRLEESKISYDTGLSSNSNAPTDGVVQQQAETIERLIIRTGYLSIIATDSEAAVQSITAIAAEHNGWVVNSSLSAYRTGKRGEITIRVPADAYDPAIKAIKAVALEVSQESSSSQDVTEEYVDLSARLTNLEATADRVRAFLDEAKTVEEALAVNQELSRLEGQIEQIKGRMQYLSQSAAFSTIQILVTPDQFNEPISIDRWQASGTAKDAISALIEALQGIASFLIWAIIYLIPVGLLIGFPIYLISRTIYRRIRRRRNNQA